MLRSAQPSQFSTHNPGLAVLSIQYMENIWKWGLANTVSLTVGLAKISKAKTSSSMQISGPGELTLIYILYKRYISSG